MSFKRCTKTHDDQLLLLPRDKDQDKYPKNCARSRTGGWWYNACTWAHPTGLSSTTKKPSWSEKYVFYYFGGERGVKGRANGRENFAEAEFLLVPK